MNIQRKYSLPNCTLLLEGLNDASKTTQYQEMRPELSILVNAECTLSGYTQPLAGGRQFFESLVRAVSAYAQEFLSNISNPQAHNSESELVQLEKINSNQHRLSVHSDMPQQDLNNGSNAKQTIKIDLNSVQLFDLVEAVDQFFADTQTLPELTLELQPVARGHSAVQGVLLEQAVPATLGLTSLAAAAIAFNLMPAPEFKTPSTAQKKVSTTENVKQPVQPTPEAKQPATNAVPTPIPSPNAPGVVRDLEKLLGSAPEIKNASRLKKLNTQVYEQLNKAWANRQVQSDLVYRLGAAGDGAIIGYKAIDQTANAAIEQTPLPKVLYNPANSGAIANEPIAQFRVVFRQSGVLEVSPWIGYVNKSDNLGTNITDQNTLSNLNQKLSAAISQNKSANSNYSEVLKYRVAVKENGSIADYEPLNKAAFDNFRQTPIPKLFPGDNPNAAQTEPLAQFQVEFKPGGEAEITPWQGYR
ncbi:DUF4335 domain-containing protein [Rivularia sp. UHCC 0363]|uniref:DUF4335 domain-containing protein n=1 Tax=Rivularia sp. UHCC 0363 TaxID=3110244 RepID=UPI002B21E7B0|nr:DUF4335 domain-containing protein [Rivularia sp. UHCC 0363]MEA5595318.1 DUF4335 domain-containing protein [Rivularia sp. UHCC 0363]